VAPHRRSDDQRASSRHSSPKAGEQQFQRMAGRTRALGGGPLRRPDRETEDSACDLLMALKRVPNSTSWLKASRDRELRALCAAALPLAPGRMRSVWWTLNRPERKNPLTFDSYAELCDLFRGLVATREVKSLVITGAGGNFCSGGDVHEIIAADTHGKRRASEIHTHDGGSRAADAALSAADHLPRSTASVPARVHVLRWPRICVWLLRVRGTAFCLLGSVLPVVTWAPAHILPRIIARDGQSELLYTGRAMSAEEGVAWGFFNRIVAAEELERQALALAAELARGPHWPTR